jgi:hypothetical protein
VQVRDADLARHFFHRHLGARKQVQGALEPAAPQVVRSGKAELGAEQARQMRRRNAGWLRQIRQ